MQTEVLVSIITGALFNLLMCSQSLYTVLLELASHSLCRTQGMDGLGVRILVTGHSLGAAQAVSQHLQTSFRKRTWAQV